MRNEIPSARTFLANRRLRTLAQRHTSDCSSEASTAGAGSGREDAACGAQFAGLLFPCNDELTPDPDTWEIINYTTSAVFEETLHCSDAGTNFAYLQQRFPQVADYEEG